MQDMNIKPRLCERLTFGIPVRIDNQETKENLLAVIKYLAGMQCYIIVLEADAMSHANEISCMKNVEYLFIEDTDTGFHRTHYINVLLHMATTEMVAIWSADVLVDYNQIFEALQLIQQGATITYPYDGRFIMLPEQLSEQTRHKLDFEYLRNLRMKPFPRRKLCSGAYIVHKLRYLQCGGENERFTGWGLEDVERMHRVTILGHIVCHISMGELFHLYHPKGINSSYQSKEDARHLREEFIRICCMSPEELKTYISK